MAITTLEELEHEPYPVDEGEKRAWCRTCTRYYQAVIVYPCSHARKRGGGEADDSDRAVHARERSGSEADGGDRAVPARERREDRAVFARTADSEARS